MLPAIAAAAGVKDASSHRQNHHIMTAHAGRATSSCPAQEGFWFLFCFWFLFAAFSSSSSCCSCCWIVHGAQSYTHGWCCLSHSSAAARVSGQVDLYMPATPSCCLLLLLLLSLLLKHHSQYPVAAINISCSLLGRHHGAAAAANYCPTTHHVLEVNPDSSLLHLRCIWNAT
jgi:hypothetical protein